MMVFLLLLVLASRRLYLKDGNYHSIREYQVLADRVRYYSTERGDWEEIPLDLVDLPRTKVEAEKAEAERRARSVDDQLESQAERARRLEIEKVPQEDGAYWINGEEMAALKRAESKVVTNRKRSLLKAISPIPIVAGKATLKIDGETSPFVVTSLRPEFYFRISKEERFKIVRVSAVKSSRIVEKWSIIPVTKEIVQEHGEVEIFRHQAEDGLYKIWPQKPVAPGEYAIIQYTEGKGNTQVWDFRVQTPGP